MKLIKEEIYGWHLYQFLLDDKDKKYIKYITAIDDGGLWDFTFYEGDTLEDIQREYPSLDRVVAMSIMSMFRDNDNWVVEE
jgi:hypothetical protein